jgi:uncharacterized membrane protein YfcA
LLLFVAGFLAATMNAIAGGGSFVSFPALIFAGVPAVSANASSTVALFPGTMASSWAYRGLIGGFGGLGLGVLLGISVAGGLLGALLLLFTPAASFDALVPWLLLVASVTFAFGREAGEWLRARVRLGRGPLVAAQFVLGIYGGYFGGAVGIMMMAAWMLLGQVDLKALNATRMLLVSAMNGVAVLCFVAAGVVSWPQCLAMLGGSVGGGYLGARAVRGMDPRIFRRLVVVLTFGMTGLFFVRRYWGG